MTDFFDIDFTRPVPFLLFTGTTFLIIFLRYLFISGIYHFIFYKWLRPQFQNRIINLNPKTPHQYKQEILRSAITSFIFALSGTILLILWQKGWTGIYLSWTAYPLWYLPVSLLIAMLIHETYYYWLHRWMHRPKIYRVIHKWHHESIETSSMTSFSFHPIESVLQALMIPVLIIFLPMHIGVLMLFLVIMTISATINHAGVEIYPANFNQHWLGKWIIGATHHDLHHKEFRYNFGLYFTFWDHWMKTESPKSDTWFKQHTQETKQKK